MKQRWQTVLAVTVLAVGAVTIGLVVSTQGGAPSPDSKPTLSRHSGVLAGDGIGRAKFGQPELSVVANLRKVLGAPKVGRPVDMAGNCTIDSAMEWPTITAYFLRGTFVGYATSSLLSAPGQRRLPNATTAAGLRVGDPLSRAEHLYGRSLQTSYAQGGSWSAVTSSGIITGYLTSEVNSTKPTPRIADITAGSVGCPAASP